MFANLVQNCVSDIGDGFFRPVYGREQRIITVEILSRHSTIMSVTLMNVRVEIVDIVQICGSRVLLLLSVHALNHAVGDFLQMLIAFQAVSKRDASGFDMSLKRRFDFHDARTGAIERDGVRICRKITNRFKKPLIIYDQP